jgi:hypothetical protein
MAPGTQLDILDKDGGTNPIIEAGATATLVANTPSGLANLGASNAVVNNNHAGQNAVSNQQAVSKIGLAAISKAVQMVSTMTPQQARSSQSILTGNSAVQPATVLVPPPKRIPVILPSGTVYANVPLYLVYDNEGGFENILGVAVNHVQNPIPSGETVYGAITDLPLVFSYEADGELIVEKTQARA